MSQPLASYFLATPATQGEESSRFLVKDESGRSLDEVTALIILAATSSEETDALRKIAHAPLSEVTLIDVANLRRWEEMKKLDARERQVRDLAIPEGLTVWQIGRW